MSIRTDFAVFILSHGRADNIVTYSAIRRLGYTGQIVIVIDDTDTQKEKYIQNFGSQVVVFSKKDIAPQVDIMNNFGKMNSVVFARHACWEIAARLGLKYFTQFDDDYGTFQYRYDGKCNYNYKTLSNLDAVFEAMIGFVESTPAYSIAMAQGGDFIGGDSAPNAQGIRMLRKCMNSFVCATEKPFKFFGPTNDDVNMYVFNGRIGRVVGTTNQVLLCQKQTQQNSGGMTDEYLDTGTYVKSFYSVMMNPSAVKVGVITDRNSRIHHVVKWENAAVKIVSESLKKK